MDRDELLKEKLKSKKESIKSAFSNRLTYDKWDKKSPIYAYSILTSEFEKIEDVKRIKFLLLPPNIIPYTVFFSNKKDMETYKWINNTITKEIDDRIAERSIDNFNSFVDYKDVALGDCNVFYIKD